MNLEKSRSLARRIYNSPPNYNETHRELLHVSIEALDELEYLVYGDVSKGRLSRALNHLRAHSSGYALFCTMMPLVHWWEAECGPIYYQANSADPNILTQTKSLSGEAMDFITSELSSVVGYKTDAQTIEVILQNKEHFKKFELDIEKYSPAINKHFKNDSSQYPFY